VKIMMRIIDKLTYINKFRNRKRLMIKKYFSNTVSAEKYVQKIGK
jgi:hypothetical protein